MDESSIIDFGIFEDFSITFNTSNITNIYPLNHRECIASTSKEIIRFERKIIKTRFPYTFSSCIAVPETEYIIGVTSKYGTLTVLKLSDISDPILKDYQTNHNGIFHMFYSPKSNSLITVGSGICVFTFHYMQPNKKVSIVNPKVSFKHRSSFANNYDTTILISPPFDHETELIYLPTSDGICPFTLDGKQMSPYTRVPATIKTVYTFNYQSKKLLTYDSTDGMSLWGPSDNLICHFSTAGSSLIAMLFVDQENVICLNSFNSLFFLNIKTGRTFHCITLQQRPTRLFLIYLQNQPLLFVCFANAMKAMKIVIPWRVWNINVKNSIEIQRCNKFCEAARVIVATSGSFVKFYAPKNGEKVTVATPKLAVNSASFFYDRGLFERYTLKKEKLEFDVKIEQTLPGNKREVLFVVLENGRIIGFNTTVSPCDEVMNIKSKATFMTICRYGEKWAYAAASENSDLYILDYQNLNETHHFTVINDKLLKMFFHYESDSIVMVFRKKTLLFDLKKGQIGDTLLIDGNHATSLFSNMIKYGYESGHIAHVEIADGLLVRKDQSGMQRPHSEKVSCFSFSLNFWISLGDDGKVIFWDYSNEKICQLSFPIPLVAGVIMNGKRDVLAATESEVMLIEGSSVFGKNEVDREITEIDNFDRINDKLSSEVIFPLPSYDDDEVKSLLQSKKDDEDEYEYAEEEEEIQIVHNLPSSSTDLNGSQKIEKKVIVEDNEEQKMKKLEAMQALNGVKQKPPELENLLKEEAKKTKKLLNGDKNDDNQPPKKPKKQSSISRRDEKSLTQFIANSMEKEKEKIETKPKKEKTAKKRSKSNVENENEIDLKNRKINKPNKILLSDSNKNNGNGEDDENLVLRMKDNNKRAEREINRKSDNDNNRSKEEDDEDNGNVDLSQNEQSQSNQQNEDESKPNDSKSDSQALNSKNSQKVDNSIKENNKSIEKVDAQKITDKKNKKLISIGIQPVSEKKQESKKKEENQKEKTETKKNDKKSIEKVEPKPKKEKSEDEKDTKNVKNQKSKNNTDTKSDTKPTSNEPKTKPKIKPSSSNSPPKAKKSPRKKPELPQKSEKKINSKPKVSESLLNSNASKIESKPIEPLTDPFKKPDPLAGKRPRCPTPPIVRWKKPTVMKKPPKRASTPPLKNERPIMFSIPPPNVVLDKAAVLEFYGRGKTELKPLVDLINEESERIRSYIEYYKFHVKNYGTLSRYNTDTRKSDTINASKNRKNGCRNRFFYRRFPEPGTFVTADLPPASPSFYGSFFFFNDEGNNSMTCDVKNEEIKLSESGSRKREVTSSVDNLPKFHKMQYAKPLNLIDKNRSKPSIKQPQCSSQKCQFQKHNQATIRPNNSSIVVEFDKEDEVQSNRDCVVDRNDNNLTYKPSNIHHPRNLNSAKKIEPTRPNWSLFYPNFESCSNFDVGYDDGFVVDSGDARSASCVDLLANVVMLKVPSLELPVSPGYKRTKSVRYRSPTTSRRIVNSPFYHQNIRKK